VLGP